MKKGLVLYLESKNIGDDIQGYAARQFLGADYEIYDRENLDAKAYNEPAKVICNGWFLDHPDHWPPNPNIEPLFISFHIGKFSGVRKALLNPALLAYYKQHEPIGCRDIESMSLFNSMGVEAYFSGCLTLTLPASTAGRGNSILVVDPFVNDILDEKYSKELMLKLIPEAYHEQVEFITHVRQSSDRTGEERLNDAEEILNKYGQARMVITSRIHCALPCLALGTPVYFMDVGYERPKDRDRFEGIINLFHTLRPNLPFHGNRRIDKLIKLFDLHKLFSKRVEPLPIDFENPSQNKPEYKELAQKLKERVEEFISA